MDSNSSADAGSAQLRKFWPDIFILMALAAGVSAVRSVTIHAPMDHDITYYATAAHELLMGRPFYSGLMDHKPFGVHLTYAGFELLFGYNLRMLLAMTVATAVLTMIAVYAGAAVLAGRIAGLAAAAIWCIISGLREIGGHLPNTESFINVCTTWALVLMFGFCKWRQYAALLRAGIIGLLFFIATLYKQVAAVPAVGLFLVHLIVAARRTASFRIASVETVVAAAVAIGGWCAYVAYFVLTGRATFMYDGMVLFNKDYAGDLKVNLVDGFRAERLFPSMLTAVMPLVLLCAITLLVCRPRISPRQRLLLVGLGVSTFVAVSLPGRWYGHYYQLYFPLLSIMSGIAACSWRHAPIPMSRVWWPLPGASAVFVVMLFQEQAFRVPLDAYELPPEKNIYVHARNVGKTLRNVLSPTDRIFHWGNESGLYFYSGCRPVSGWLTPEGVVSGRIAEKLQAKQIAELEATPPALVILLKDYAPDGLQGNPVLESIRDKYVPLPGLNETPWFLLYVLKGTELEKRLQQSPLTFSVT